MNEMLYMTNKKLYIKMDLLLREIELLEIWYIGEEELKRGNLNWS